jgi:diguanylate cyclase (GGDEF)-like protein
MDSQSKISELLRENEGLRREIAKLEDLRALVYRDPLTGLWNRRYFAERLGSELNRARRQQGRHFSIVILDVNDFRRINDAHGPVEGDLVLRWVGEFLERSVRSYDVCCRIGADAFGLILLDMAQASAPMVLDRLRANAASVTAHSPFHISLSFGSSTYPEDGDTFDALLRVAEDARYLDKSNRPKVTPLKE